MSFHWMRCVAQDIRKMAGDEIYQRYGQEIIDCLKRTCSENFEIARYPDDDEIGKAIEKAILHNNKR